MSTNKKPPLTRADIEHGTIALGLIASLVGFALMMFLAEAGDEYFGNIGSMVGSFIGVLAIAAAFVGLMRREKKMLAAISKKGN